MKKLNLLAIVSISATIALNSCLSFGDNLDDNNNQNNETVYWQKANSTTTETLSSVFFINESTGWSVGYNNTILKTNDGGINWIKQNYEEYASFNDVFFIDEKTGWIVGQYGTLLKTTNGGLNWSLLARGDMENAIKNPFKKIEFYDSNIGWIIGDGSDGSGGFILKTTNGGIDWETCLSDLPTHLFSIKIIDNKHILIGGGFDSPALLYETKDGGINWTQFSIGTKDFDINDIAHRNGTIYLVCGWQNFGYISTDSGLTWESRAELSSSNNIFVNDQFIWLTGGANRFSTDQGNTWIATTEKNSNYVNNGNGLMDTFSFGNKIWGVASNGNIFYYFMKE